MKGRFLIVLSTIMAGSAQGRTGYDAVSRAGYGGLLGKNQRSKGYGVALQANEALDVLSLRPGATLVEIKEAYRDLVKVWHPDRFGSNPRLRGKAEEKLKQINEAYRVLQFGVAAGGGMEVGGSTRTASSSRGEASSGRYSSSARKGRARWKRNAVGVGWIYGCLGIALVFVSGYLALERGGMRTAGSSLAPVERTADSSPQATRAAAAMETAGGVAAGWDVHAGGRLDRKDESKDAGRSNRAGSAQFRVWSLSDAERSRFESVCSRQEQQGPDAYRDCVKAQLDLMTNESGLPDLTALSGAERESMESVCSGGKRLHGSGAYRSCVTGQMAALAAEPSRPDLSALNDADRDAIELACRNAKRREGPAAYDRCLVRTSKLLAESR